MDIRLPTIDGYETTRQVRAVGYSGPIVAITARGDGRGKSKSAIGQDAMPVSANPSTERHYARRSTSCCRGQFLRIEVGASRHGQTHVLSRAGRQRMRQTLGGAGATRLPLFFCS